MQGISMTLWKICSCGVYQSFLFMVDASSAPWLIFSNISESFTILLLEMHSTLVWHYEKSAVVVLRVFWKRIRKWRLSLVDETSHWFLLKKMQSKIRMLLPWLWISSGNFSPELLFQWWYPDMFYQRYITHWTVVGMLNLSLKQLYLCIILVRLHWWLLIQEWWGWRLQPGTGKC